MKTIERKLPLVNVYSHKYICIFYLHYSQSLFWQQLPNFYHFFSYLTANRMHQINIHMFSSFFVLNVSSLLTSCVNLYYPTYPPISMGRTQFYASNMDTQQLPLNLPPLSSFLKKFIIKATQSNCFVLLLCPNNIILHTSTNDFLHFWMWKHHQKFRLYQLILLFNVDLPPYDINLKPFIIFLLLKFLPVIIPIVINPGIPPPPLEV